MNFDEEMEVFKHLTGYDIEPSMVKIAEMNMFLHGATEPNIFEYDTLTDDSKWNDKFNVILANPPFMTPKGGIKPHNKFSVKATRSEVLFVDYIINHLRVDGRAAVIVPEGVVYQSGTAFRNVRKEALDRGVISVISLPQGVFQPYSGIKTCILIIDKQAAKLTNKILFVDLHHDGFDLGAQRTPIKENDIPTIIKLLKKYTDDVINEKEIDIDSYKSIYSDINLVNKTEINEKNNYTFESAKYRKHEGVECTKYNSVLIGDLFDSGRGRVISKEYIKNHKGEYPVYSSQTQDNGILGYIDTYDFNEEMITWTTDGANAGTVFHRSGKFNCTNVCGTLKLKKGITDVNLQYVVIVLNRIAKKFVSIASGNPKLMNNVMEGIAIPLPDIETQNNLVSKINKIEMEKAALNMQIAQCNENIKHEIDLFWE